MTRSECRKSIDILGLFLQSSGRFSSLFQWIFSQLSGMVSSILQWGRWSNPTFWRVFFSLFMKNEKEILILDVYLITLTLHRWDSFAGFICFGFLLLKVLFFVKQFSNFNMSDEQGAYALTVNLATDIFFHRADRGCLY